MARSLVIDDSPLFRLVLREILTKGGNEVYEASTVEEGLRIFRTISPDLVFKDLIMEDSNPLEVIKDLIRYSPTAKIVICSTEGQKNLIYQAIRAGAMDFLIKPFNTNEVTMTVERLLAK
jgi:two-component system chemotaxis response regulator CheY